MSKLKIWQTIIVVLLVVNSTVLAFIWFKPRDQRAPTPMGDVQSFLTKELELNAQQQKQYGSLRNEHIALMQQINKETRDLRDQLFKNISTQLVDSTLINSLSQKISANEARKDQVTLYHFRKLRSILNEKQQARFDNIIQDALKMMGRQPPPGKGPAPQWNGVPPDKDRQGRPDGYPPPGGKGPPDGGPPDDRPPPPNQQ